MPLASICFYVGYLIGPAGWVPPIASITSVTKWSSSGWVSLSTRLLVFYTRLEALSAGRSVGVFRNRLAEFRSEFPQYGALGARKEASSL